MNKCAMCWDNKWSIPTKKIQTSSRKLKSEPHLKIDQTNTHSLSPTYGLFTLPASDSDFKPNSYIAIPRKCSHCTNSDFDPSPAM